LLGLFAVVYTKIVAYVLNWIIDHGYFSVYLKITLCFSLLKLAFIKH